MKQALLTFLLVACSGQAAPTLKTQWQNFPLSQLPQLKADDGMKGFLDLVRQKGRQQALSLPGTLYDPANGYANFQLGDEGFLEFIVWNAKQKNGYVLANRYLGEEQHFQFWKFNDRDQFTHVPELLRVSQSEAKAAYQRITGTAAKTAPTLHWDFPRQGTTITVSLNPSDRALLSKCKVISDVEYDCAEKLNVAEFRWTGTQFVKRLIR